MTSSPAVTPLAARDDLAGALARMRKFWTGRDAVLITGRHDGAKVKHIGELESCGAKVRAVVSKELPTDDAPPVPALWSFAAHGFPGLSQRQFDGLLADPPAEFAAWLAAHDPNRSWTLVGSPHTQIGEVAGRPVHGWRRPEWGLLEDKIRNEALWRDAGVPSAPHVICAPDDPSLGAHARAIDEGHGVVLALDSSRGIHGSATGLRWIRSTAELDAARDWACQSAEEVRLAPFVPGIPFSMLGMVLRDGVSVFNPIEIITLLDEARGQFLYCGTATHWRPDEADVATVRAHTRAVATKLAGAGYRGIFGMDGIVDDAHRVVWTDLNPRHAAGLGLRAAWPEFPIYMFQPAVQERLPGLYDLDPLLVERAVNALVGEHPSISVRIPLSAERVLPGHSSSADDAGSALSHRLTVAPGVEQTVAYRMDGDGAALVSIDPPLRDRSVTPAAAALAGRIGTAELRTPRALPATSTLAQSREQKETDY